MPGIARYVAGKRIKGILSFFVISFLSSHVVEAQPNYKFLLNNSGVRVTEGTVVFHRRATVDLLELYAPIVDGHADEAGAAILPKGDHLTYFDILKLSDDGYVEIKVYDFDESRWAKGNLIYGARSHTTGRNFKPDSWDASNEFKHWDKFGHQIPIESTKTKFLSQFEKMGSLNCISRPPYYVFNEENIEMAKYLTVGVHIIYMMALAANAFDPNGNNVDNWHRFIGAAAVASWLVASQAISFLYSMDATALVYDQPSIWEAFKQWANAFYVDGGELCSPPIPIPSPVPLVVMEVTVHNCIFYEAKVPGLPMIQGDQLFEKEEIVFLPQPTGFRKIDLTDFTDSDRWILPEDFGIKLEEAVARQIPDFPVPNILLLPTFSSETEIKKIRFTIPQTGRLTVIGERQKMKLLRQDMETDEFSIKIMAIDALQVEKSDASEPLHYDMYAFVGNPDYQFDLDVSPEGPFLVHFGFAVAPGFPEQEPEIILRQKTITDEADEILTGEHNDRYNWRLYPNPAKGMLHVRFDLNERSEINLRLTDIRGNIVYEDQLQLDAGMHPKIIDVQGASPGLYVLQVRTQGHERSVKILME
ncbi:MAG: T9SS type A sorting domain-containing protein [Bacteroidota bacterium]